MSDLFRCLRAEHALLNRERRAHTGQDAQKPQKVATACAGSPNADDTA